MMKKWLGLAVLIALAGTTAFAAAPFAAVVEHNGQWGAITGTDKKIIPLVYDRIGNTLEKGKDKLDPAVAEDGKNNEQLGLIEVESKGVRGFYDRSGKLIVPPSYTKRSTWTDGTLLVKEKNSYGYYAVDGRRIAPAQYDSATVFCEGFAGVGKGTGHGFIDLTGAVAVPLIYDQVGQFQEGLAVVHQQGAWGVINKTGQIVVPLVYEDMQYHYQNGFIGIKEKGYWGFADTTGRVVIAPQFKSILSGFSEGRAAVETKNGYAFIDTTGHIIADSLKNIYTPFSEGLAAVRTQHKGKGYMDTAGNLVFPADYQELGAFHDGLAEYGQMTHRTVVGGQVTIGIGNGNEHTGNPVYIPSVDRELGIGIGTGAAGFEDWAPYGHPYGSGVSVGAGVTLHKGLHRGYLNKQGKVVVNANADYVYPMTDQGTFVYNHERWGYVRRDGSYIVPPNYAELSRYDNVNLFLVKNKDDKWGALSLAEGAEVIPCVYDLLAVHGDALIYKEQGHYGLMSNQGQVITAPIYQEIGTAAEGLVPVKEKNQWAYVDMTGRTIFAAPAGTQQAGTFVSGYAPIKVNGKWGVIDKSGEITVVPVYDKMEVV